MQAAGITTKGDSRRLAFFLLIAMQVTMVICLVALVRSSWFGEFFNRRARDTLVCNYRVSKEKDPSTLEAAARFSSASSRRRTFDFEIFEEEARSSAAKHPEQAKLALAKLSALAKGKNFNQVERDVAMQKYVREQLFLAKCLLKGGRTDEAAASLSKALAGLQRIQGSAIAPKIEMIRTLVKLSAGVALARGNRQLFDECNLRLERLADPDYARTFYEANLVRGYDYDYNAQYRLQWNMVTGLRGKGSDGIKSVTKALALCTESVVPDSTKVEVLRMAMNLAKTEYSFDLEKLVLEKWYQINQNSGPTTAQDASFLLVLWSTARHVQNRDISMLLLSRLCDAMERDLFSADLVSDEFQAKLLSQCSMLAVLFPNNKKHAEEMVALSERFQRVAARFKQDDAVAFAMRVPSLVYLGRIGEAQQSVEVAMSRSQSYRFIEMEAFANVVHCVARYLTDHHEAATAQKLLRKALKNVGWDNSSRATLIISLCESLGCQSGNVSPEWLQLVSQLDRIAKSGSLHKPTEVGVDEFRLRALMMQEKQIEAGQLYAALKKKYGNDARSLAQICGSQLNYFRAWPSYSPKYFAMALKGAYPEGCFLDAPALFAKIYAKDSDESGQMYLWLGQYFMTKGQPQLALPYVRKILLEWKEGQTIAYYAAKDMCEELSGKAASWPEGKLVMTTRDMHQLESLAAVYHTAGRPAGCTRVKKLLERVKVLDP
ncbi:MAG: hypothetical protein K2W95_10435 [Candidatus Obscuribacterales bacterium]|nr:hypothetical protein [Candidatus Obscuribacterales bacterium]